MGFVIQKGVNQFFGKLYDQKRPTIFIMEITN